MNNNLLLDIDYLQNFSEYVKDAFTDARENCQGMVAAAGKGTLLFDEIGEMPLEMQPKLLQLLQEG